MMKKRICALLALVMVFSLAACGGGNSGGGASAAKGADLPAFLQSLKDKYGEEFNCTMDLTDPDASDMMEMCFPGLKDVPVKQLVVNQPMMSAVVCEIAMAEVENAADVDKVKGIFQSRIDAQVDGGAWYPESVAGWQNNSRIVTNGNYVLMIAWENCDEVVEQFNALFK